MLKGIIRGAVHTARLWLIVAAVVAAGVVLAEDRGTVLASHTKVYFTTTSSGNPTQLATLTVFPGSPTQTLYVWAKDVDHDPQGLGAFEVDIRYDPNVLRITSITKSTAWLTSTGRTPLCYTEVVGPVPGDPNGWWQAKAQCATLNPTPAGPGWNGTNDSGLLATFVVGPGPQPQNPPLPVEYGAIAVADDGQLLDTGQVINQTVIEPQQIVASWPTLTAIHAKCGDFNSNGAVSATDIFLLFNKFGTVAGPPPSAGWDPKYDLNANGAVSAPDIFIELTEFGVSCTA